jgi:alpha-D-ribose 1-methylphosphonate 5-triphosphate synthase subunit PhnG
MPSFSLEWETTEHLIIKIAGRNKRAIYISALIDALTPQPKPKRYQFQLYRTCGFV